MKIGFGLHGTETVPWMVHVNHSMCYMTWVRDLTARGHSFAFASIGQAKVAAARRVVVENLLKSGCTHWLCIDNDHILPLELLPRLVETAERECAGMVSALVTKRLFPFDVVAFKRSPQGVMLPLDLRPSTGVWDVDVCAWGCTLVALEPLRKLEKPWFFDTPTHRSDVNFCLRYRDIGQRVLVDTSVQVGHLVEPEAVWPGESAHAFREAWLRSGRVVQE